MAKASNNNSTILNLALVLSLALIIAVAESRAIINAKSTPSVDTVLVCDTVTAVSSGDTCFDIAKSNNMTIAQFDSINPNLNCNRLFVGQWLCIVGFTV